MKNRMKKITCVILIIVCLLSVWLLSSCKDDSGIYYVEENTEYTFDLLQSTAMSLPFALALNNNESYIQFNTDKTVKIRLIANSALLQTVQESYDLNKLVGDTNVEKLFNFYAPNFVPGADIDNIGETLNLICQSFNLTLYGLDFVNEQSEELAQILKREKPIPDDFEIPSQLGFEVNETYYIKDVQNENGIVKGVFIGEYDENTEPFLIMTMYEEKNNKDEIVQKLSYRIEVIQMYAQMTKTKIA